MPYLLDTNILTRYVTPSDPMHVVVNSALRKLTQLGEAVYLTPQNLIEFRHVATRPATGNGLGWTAAQAEQASAIFEGLFGMLADAPAIFSEWKHLVHTTSTTGKTIHDARLAAVAVVYGVPYVLTFDDSGFRRFIPYGIEPVDPALV